VDERRSGPAVEETSPRRAAGARSDQAAEPEFEDEPEPEAAFPDPEEELEEPFSAVFVEAPSEDFDPAPSGWLLAAASERASDFPLDPAEADARESVR
jgi:hypothetical protein